MKVVKRKLYKLTNLTNYFKKVFIGEGESRKAINTHFTNGTIQDGVISGGTFGTDDEEVQNALEDNIDFKKGVYKIFKRVEKEEKTAVISPDAQKIAGITTVQEAGDWLREQGLGIKATEVNTKAGVLEQSQKHNIVFTDMQL